MSLGIGRHQGVYLVTEQRLQVRSVLETLYFIPLEVNNANGSMRFLSVEARGHYNILNIQ